MNLRDHKLFFCDVETTGLNANIHEVIDVGVVLTDFTGRDTLDEFSTRIMPFRKVDEHAIAVNGYSRELWEVTARPKAFAASRVYELSENAIFVAHNAVFDWAFVSNLLYAYELKWQGDYHRICTGSLALPLVLSGAIEKIQLGALAEHFGIAVPDGAEHTALGDARTLRLVYLKLTELYARAVKEIDYVGVG